MIYRGGSFGRALAPAPTSRAETSFCRSPVVRLLLIIQVPDASDKRGVGLLLRPINRFSLRFEGAERMVRVVLHKARLDKTGQGTGTRTRRHASYIAPPLPESESVALQVRQLGNVGGDAPGSALNHDCSHSPAANLTPRRNVPAFSMSKTYETSPSRRQRFPHHRESDLVIHSRVPRRHIRCGCRRSAYQ